MEAERCKEEVKGQIEQYRGSKDEGKAEDAEMEN